MRLLKLDREGEPSLTEFFGDKIPRYAILSHTWGADGEEVTFKDITKRRGKNKIGYRKIQLCGKFALADDINYFWVDTCCIDKSSSAELSEAINSMFRWYLNAAKCYVYLSDVSSSDSTGDDTSSQQVSKSVFEHSRWFTRGWTLQELLAPSSVEFFSVEGGRLGDKGSLVQEIHGVTGISMRALQGDPLPQFSIEERMSWAAKRDTTREEDMAYSLLGIFDITMPLLYGEGWKKAFVRLQQEITKSLEDDLPALPQFISSKYQGSPLNAFSTLPDQRNAGLRINAEVSGFDIKKTNSTQSDTSILVSTPSDETTSNSTQAEEITWYGQFRHKRDQNNDSPYIRERNKVASASYRGNWEEVIALLESRKVGCGETWVNCWRMKETSGTPSGFTALHQAAWHGAPKRVFQELLRLGAWRFARTLRPSGNSLTRSTPYDLAKACGHDHLYDLLCPVVRRPIDPRTLQTLQHKLHALITEHFPPHLLETLFLPDLEVMTEFENADLWFPLNPEVPDTQGRLGVHVTLVRDGLVVVVHKAAKTSRFYILTYKVEEIPDGSLHH